ncbi:MAG: response regulator transcription factor, partial [Desulfarculaceae bacterium]
GYEVFCLSDGSGVLQTVASQNPDMVILDIMLPQRDGLDVLRDLRGQSQVPVIMLTARGEDADRIVGLELGADDYLPKPFNPRELLARMKAVLRRSPEQGAGDSKEPEGPRYIEAGGLKLDMARHTLRMGEDELELSATEYRILRAMMSRPDTVFTRDRLLQLSRGRDLEAFDRSIDVHISNLRAKLKSHPRFGKVIKTVWGTGYMFVGNP